jgi:hypothetical protein
MFDEAAEKLGTYASARTILEKDKIKKESFDAFMSMVMIHNSDQDKYGSLIQMEQQPTLSGVGVHSRECHRDSNCNGPHNDVTCKDEMAECSYSRTPTPRMYVPSLFRMESSEIESWIEYCFITIVRSIV